MRLHGKHRHRWRRRWVLGNWWVLGTWCVLGSSQPLVASLAAMPATAVPATPDCCWHQFPTGCTQAQASGPSPSLSPPPLPAVSVLGSANVRFSNCNMGVNFADNMGGAGERKRWACRACCLRWACCCCTIIKSWEPCPPRAHHPALLIPHRPAHGLASLLALLPPRPAPV